MELSTSGMAAFIRPRRLIRGTLAPCHRAGSHLTHLYHAPAAARFVNLSPLPKFESQREASVSRSRETLAERTLNLSLPLPRLPKIFNLRAVVHRCELRDVRGTAARRERRIRASQSKYAGNCIRTREARQADRVPVSRLPASVGLTL